MKRSCVHPIKSTLAGFTNIRNLGNMNTSQQINNPYDPQIGNFFELSSAKIQLHEIQIPAMQVPIYCVFQPSTCFPQFPSQNLYQPLIHLYSDIKPVISNHEMMQPIKSPNDHISIANPNQAAEESKKVCKDLYKSNKFPAKNSIEGITKNGKIPGSIQRNVYKSILRHISTYIKSNRVNLIDFLNSKGYSMEDIEHAYFEIDSLIDKRMVESGLKFKQALNNLITKKSIYTHIVKETIGNMLENLKNGCQGKIGKENTKFYIAICAEYYNEVEKVLSSQTTH